MKPNELRIGNYVYGLDKLTHSVEEISPIRVTTKAIVANSTSTHHDTAENTLHPIPLTSGIARLMGLKTATLNERDTCFRIDDRYELHTANVESDCAVYLEGNLVAYFRYVHEFQNLYFAIEREELYFE